MHLVDDPGARVFSSWLLDVSHGRGCSDNETISLPGVDTFISEIHPGIGFAPPSPPEYFGDRIILAPRNNDVDNTNNKLLGMMSDEEQVFTALTPCPRGKGLTTKFTM